MASQGLSNQNETSEELLPGEVLQPPFLISKLPFSHCPLHSLDIYIADMTSSKPF